MGEPVPLNFSQFVAVSKRAKELRISSPFGALRRQRAQLGLRSEWSPGGPCFLSGKVMSALPCSTRPLLFSIDLTVGYQCWGCADHGGRVCLGIGDDMMHSEDHQGVSTHSKADRG